MIKIDNNNALYRYLVDVGCENVDDDYMHYVQNGITNVVDFRRLILDDNVANDIDMDDESLADVLDYYNDIKNYKDLTEAKQKQALDMYKQTNDPVYKDEFIHANVKTALAIACNYARKYANVQILDIVQTANMALFKVIEKYHSDTKLKVVDFVHYWLRIEIIAQCSTEDRR